MSSSHQFLRQIVCREIRTLYSVSEMLECGHRFESLSLLSDPLIAKRRVCPVCSQAASLLQIPRKPPGSTKSASASVEQKNTRVSFNLQP
jgi:hypothetical protein